MQHFGELHNTHIVSCIISSFLLKKDILSFQNTRGGVYGSFFIIHGQQWSLWRARTPLSLCRLCSSNCTTGHPFQTLKNPISSRERFSCACVSELCERCDDEDLFGGWLCWTLDPSPCANMLHQTPPTTPSNPFLWERAISDKVPMCVGSVVVAVILGGVNKEQFPATPRGFQQEICRWISTGIQVLNSKSSSRSSEKICQVES